MLQYILRRLLIAIPSLIGISVVLFVVLALAPGDPFEELATNPNVPPEVRLALRAQFGLDENQTLGGALDPALALQVASDIACAIVDGHRGQRRFFACGLAQNGFQLGGEADVHGLQLVLRPKKKRGGGTFRRPVKANARGNSQTGPEKRRPATRLGTRVKR